MEYLFFYDESEHSRKITQNTIKAENFGCNFVAAIIGYPKCNLKKIEKDFLLIEEKYKKVFCVEELKSTIISKKKYKNGFASFSKVDIDLAEDIIDFCVNYNLKLYITVQNKIFYLITQLFDNYNNSLVFDADAMVYSITKLICMYKPQNVITAIYKKDTSLIAEIKKFCLKQLSLNGDLKHKQKESVLLEQLLVILDTYDSSFTVDWDYGISFSGFKKYLKEQKIVKYKLSIDKEGSGETNKAAQKEKIISFEEDSKESVGIRVADFIAGLVSRFIISIENDLVYKDIKDNNNLKYLDSKWFDLDERRFNLYKKLKNLLVDQNNSWNKIFCSLYSDEVIYLISLLKYISSYDSFSSFKECKQHKENVNSYAVNNLKHFFELMSNKLDVNILPKEDDKFINKKGAICYKDINKYKYLLIDEVERVYYVLSVGFFGQIGKACVTIQESGKSAVYLLPDSLFEWAFNCVGFANLGEHLFPSNVKFVKFNGDFQAEIL